LHGSYTLITREALLNDIPILLRNYPGYGDDDRLAHIYPGDIGDMQMTIYYKRPFIGRIDKHLPDRDSPPAFPFA